MNLLSPAAAVLLGSLCAIPQEAAAGEPGTAGANFLHIGAGPRAIGMGEAHTALVDDAYAAYWNPAALTRLAQPEAAFMYNRLFQAMDQQYFSYAHPLRPGRGLAGSLTRFSAGSFESYDANGARRGTVDASDTALALSYGHLLDLPWSRAPEVSVGVGGKWIREQLGRFSAQGFALDLGLLVAGLEPWLGDSARGLRLGAALRHVGPGLKFNSESAPLPRTLSIGAALERRPWGDPVSVAVDYKAPIDDDPSLAIGVEYRVRRVFALRAGYLLGQDEGIGLRFGFGVSLKRVVVDYALAGFGELGSAHRVGLSYRFGGAPEEREKGPEDFVQQGQKFLRQKRYFEAIHEFNQALRLDPGNPAALEGIRQAASGMEPAKPRAPKEGADGPR